MADFNEEAAINQDNQIYQGFAEDETFDEFSENDSSIAEIVLEDVLEFDEFEDEIVLHGPNCLVLASTEDYSKRDLREYYEALQENLQALVESIIDAVDTTGDVEPVIAEPTRYKVVDTTWKRPYLTLMGESWLADSAEKSENSVFDSIEEALTAIRSTKALDGGGKYAWQSNDYVVVPADAEVNF